MDRNPNMAKILELKLKWVARDRQNKGTLSMAKTTSITSMTTNATNKGAAVICRRFTKNFLYQCDLNYLFSPLYTKDFLGSNVSSPVVNSIFIAVKLEKAKDVGGPVEFIDQQYAKRSLIPKKIAPNIPKIILCVGIFEGF
jgi:hypothetical protein